MQSCDAIVLKYNRRLLIAKLSVDVSSKLFKDRSFVINDCEYNGLVPFADWVALCDDQPVVTGIRMTTVVAPAALNNPFFNAENVTKNGEDIDVVFVPTRMSTSAEAWPYSTVYLLGDIESRFVLYIPQFYSSQQEVQLANGFFGEQSYS